MPSAVGWGSVAYGNGVFVAVSNNTTTAASSTDGITWTLRTLPALVAWYSVTYGNGVFAAISNGTTTAASSTDGITWTLRTLPSAAAWYSVTYPQRSDFSTDNYLYKSVTLAANTTQSISYEVIVLPTHEIRVRSTVPMQVAIMGEA